MRGSVSPGFPSLIGPNLTKCLLEMRAELRGASDPAQNRQGCSCGNPTRTGNDNDRNARAHIVGDQECQSRGSERKVNQIARKTVCDSLNGSTRFFRPLHGVNVLAECSIAPHPVYPDFERAGLIDRSGIDIDAPVIVA